MGAAFPNDLVYNAFTEFVNTQEALFGQATYQIVPGLKVTAGARYEKATEELSFNSLGYFASGAPYSGSATGYKTTPKGVISYEIGKTMIYASAAEGFRDGGINRPVPIPLCSPDLATLGLTQAPPSYKADSLWSYELGAKSRPLSDRLSVSGSLFDIRWNNIQTDIILPTCTFDIKDNIGSAENRGVEFETTARATEDLKINLSGNFTDARITQPVTILGVERGDHVPGVPRYQFSTALDYTPPGVGQPARAMGSQRAMDRPEPRHDHPHRSRFFAAGLLRDGRQCGHAVAALRPVPVRDQPARPAQGIAAAEHRPGRIRGHGAAADRGLAGNYSF